MRPLVEWLTTHRALALFLTLGLVAVVGSFALRLEVDNSLQAWFVDDDPALVSYRQFLQEFGGDEVVVIALTGPGAVFDPDRLARLSSLTLEVSHLEGVLRVWSLASLAVPSRESTTWMPLLDEPVDASDVERVRAWSQLSALSARFIGKDEHTLALYAWLTAAPDLEQKRGSILDGVRKAVEASLASQETAHFGGFGVVYDALNRATFGQGGMFIGLSYLVIAVALYLVTGRWRWTALALVVVTLADLTLFGAMGLLGRPLNLVTVALPALVMVLGVANVIHLTTHLDISLDKSRLSAALAVAAVPCLFNALTTGGGFLSLGTASMAVTRDYGLFAALGVLAAFVLSLVGVATLLPKSNVERTSRFKVALNAIVEALMVLSLRRRRWVIVLTALLFALAGWGVSRIVVDTYTIDFLPKEDQVRRDSEVIEEHLGPYLPLELLLRVPTEGGWKTPDFLEALSLAEVELRTLPQVGSTLSVVTLLQDLQRQLPAAADATLQSSALAALDVEALVSADGRTVRLTATVPMASARTMDDLAGRAQSLVQQAMSDRAVVEVSGYLPLYSQIVQQLLQDQLSSFALAFVVVFLLVGMVLRSWRFTLLAIPPNLMPVAMVLGAMGFWGIRLDVATVTIAAAVLGIVVDDTVHILYRLKRAISEGLSLEAAFRAIARSSGVAVVSTSFIFCAGFGVIALAQVKSVAYVGLLTAVAVVVALVMDLMLVPALASYVLEKCRPVEEAKHLKGGRA